jgi:drug/metabolite transporter (DMT)-like permease
VSSKPVGEVRGVGSVVLLMMVTFGIYGVYWNYKTFDELHRHRGKGVTGGVGILLALVGASPFVLGSYVGKAYQEADYEPTVSGWTGLWFLPGALLLGLGPIIYLIKVQGALNNLWTTLGRGSVEAPAAAEPA